MTKPKTGDLVIITDCQHKEFIGVVGVFCEDWKYYYNWRGLPVQHQDEPCFAVLCYDGSSYVFHEPFNVVVKKVWS